MRSSVSNLTKSAVGLLVAALFVCAVAGAQEELEPAPEPVPKGTGPFWDAGDIPIAEGVRSVVFPKADIPILREPRADSPRRGSVMLGAKLPLFGAHRGPGCEGRFVMVGPLAWVCTSQVGLSHDAPIAATDRPRDESDGLPFRYYFVGRDGSAAYQSFELADDAAPEQELAPGFAVAAVEERGRGSERFVHTHHGLWVPMRDLVPVRPTGFQGEEITNGKVEVAWVLAEHAPVFADGKTVTRAKGNDAKVRFEVVRVLEETKTAIRIGDGAWLRAKDVRVAHASQRPDGAGAHERWIDVDLASQTVVAYEGDVPVFATLTSTGKGAPGTETGTPKGVHRIWVKLRTSTMDNLENENATSTYQIEDVPYVQYFSKGAGIHGAFWHKQFGRTHSHGCVNLAPLDAQRLFAFTSPRLPAGWSAAIPTELEPGSIVRVR